MIPELNKIKALVDQVDNILIIQADNPDGDSLGSALALEHILGDMGKKTFLYCGVDIPYYLKFLEGWGRVSKDIPGKIDASIIVDTSSKLLLHQLHKNANFSWVSSKPALILDHHINVTCDIPFASIVCNAPDFVATGELIYEIALALGWPISIFAGENITQSILSDSLGLTSEGTSTQTYRRVADLIDKGVNRPKLEEARRALAKMQPSVFQYKAQLIQRTEFYGSNNEIGIVTIPEDELFTVGTLYNPAPLILNEITMVEGVLVGIVLKRYQDKITGSIRCSDNIGIAHTLAEHFGGGGHPYAAGFKIESPKDSFVEIKSQVINLAEELIG